MEFQVIGDVHFPNGRMSPHLSFDKFIVPTKPYLLTTGDIIQAYSPIAYAFYNFCAKNWEKTYVMMGNQEYESHLDEFNYTMDQQFELMKQLIDCINQEMGSEKLVFIQNTFIDIPEKSLRIIGLTLWANETKLSILKRDPPMDSVFGNIVVGNDSYSVMLPSYAHGGHCTPFKSWIPKEKETQPICYESITKEDLADLQKKDNEFLVRMIEETNQKQFKLLVCSHYIPTPCIKKESPIFEDENDFSYDFFCRDVSDLIRSPIIAWVCGHVHLEQTIKVNDIPIYVNVPSITV
jgi:UDP-2,3-diacylglucosamine pyrophosphatase LpxH